MSTRSTCTPPQSTGSCSRAGPAPALRSRAGRSTASTQTDNEARRRLLAGRDQIRGDRACSRHGRSERDRRVRQARLSAGPPTRQREVPAVGGRRRRALRHVLPVRVGIGLRIPAGRRARRAHRAVPTHPAFRRTFRSTRGRRCTSCCSARSPRSTGGCATGRRRRRPPGSTTDDDGRLVRDEFGDRARRCAHAMGRRTDRCVVGTRPARRHDGALRYDAATRRRRASRALSARTGRIPRVLSRAATDVAIATGFMLPADAEEIAALGAASW